MPERGDWYVIGADVAEGLSGGDWCAAEIFSCRREEQVAEYMARISPDAFGAELFLMGTLYNDALLGVEANSIGHTTLTVLVQEGYPNIFYRERIDPLERRVSTKRLGWYTSGGRNGTKGPAVRVLGQMLRRRRLVLHSSRLVQQLGQYQSHRTDAGNEQFEAGEGHDDLVSAAFIAANLMTSPQCQPRDAFDPSLEGFEERMVEAGVLRAAPQRGRANLEDWCQS